MSNAAIFDQSFYLTNNADVVVAISQGHFANALDHFQRFGGKELRNPNEFFDMSYYAINNPDVLNAVAAGGLNNVFDHFVSFGETENRAPSVTYAGFDADAYLTANTDVQEAVTAGTFASALDHFIAFGQNEARPGAITITAPVSGSSFNLTTGLDNLTGTSNNDSFAGIDDGANTTTSTLGDTIDGGAGTDTVTITSNQGNGDTAAGSQLPTITNIENLSINESTEHEDYNMSTNSALTTLTLVGGSTDADGELDITMGSGQTLSLQQVVDGDTTNEANDDGNLELESAAAVTSLSVGVSQVGAAASVAAGADVDLLVNGTGVATLNIASTGSSTNYISIANAGTALRTVNVTGSANMVVTAVVDGATTFNAGGATGNITASFGAGNDTVTGGSGDDIFTFSASNLTAADTVDGGTGSDTLIVTDVDVSSGAAALMTEIQASTNIEVLGYAATTADTGLLDAADVSSLDAFNIRNAITDAAGASNTGTNGGNGTNADGEAFTVSGIENDDTFEFDGNITGGDGGAGDGNANNNTTPTASGNGANGSIGLVLNPELDGGNNSVSITLDSATIAGGDGGNGGTGGNATQANNNGGAGGAAGDGATGISAGNFETININSIGTTANAIAGGAAGTIGSGGTGSGSGTAGANGAAGAAGASIIINTNGTINVTGTQAINIGTISGTNATVDASTLTGALTVTGEAGNNTITGGTGADTINGGNGIDVLTGGAGNDDFVFTMGANVTGGVPSASVFERISDFNDGSDELDFSMTLTIDTHTPSATAGTAQINSEGIANFEATDNTLAEKITATAAALGNGNSNGDFAVFEHSGSTYVFVSDGINAVANTDAFIQLTGVTGISNTTVTGGDLFLS
jgi:hypothetical protein